MFIYITKTVFKEKMGGGGGGVSHNTFFKEIVHPKIKIWSSFTHVIPNLYDLLSSVEHKIEILKNVGN